MEGRIRSLLLSCAATILSINFTPLHAADLDEDLVSEPIIQPEIERMNFEESRINSDNIEIVAYTGIISIENFGVNPLFGAKVAYRVSDDFFINTELGLSKAGKALAESTTLGVNFLSDKNREF